MPSEIPRILLYIIRRDVRLSDNPIFAAASRHISRNDNSESAKRSRDDSLTSEHRGASFTHLLPVYVFPANQIEISGFLSSPSAQSPYPEARSQVAKLWRTGPHRTNFIAEGVWDLKKRLEGLGCGSGLDIKVGKIGDVVKRILEFYSNSGGEGGKKADITGIWMTADESPEEKIEESTVRKIAKQNGVEFKLWDDEKYYVDDRDLPFDKISDLPNVYTSFRKSVEPLRDQPRKIIPAPTQLPPLPSEMPPQQSPFKIPSNLGDLKKALLAPLEKDPCYGLAVPPKWPDNVESAHPFEGGETNALDRIAHLVSTGAMSSYKATRNGMLGLDFSTKLSAFLSQGYCTARQVHWAMLEFEQGKGPGKDAEGYGQGENEGTAAVRFELLWRDYMRLCMRKFGSKMFDINGIQPNSKEHSNSSSSNVTDKPPSKQWRYLDKPTPGNDPLKTLETFGRFRSGRTGVGLIDASNRELFLTGYTSNRARQNVASFLTSHLNIDWRIGAEWYECMLTDYDVPSNWGNWQYVAGVGNDPRQGRIFNPVKQALDYDPQGAYIKAWVPELRHVRLTRSGTDATTAAADDVDKQRLMGLYQAYKLSDREKEQLGLKGVEWVERPLVHINFSIGRGGRGGSGRGGTRGGRGGGGSGRGKGDRDRERKTGAHAQAQAQTQTQMHNKQGHAAGCKHQSPIIVSSQ